MNKKNFLGLLFLSLLLLNSRGWAQENISLETLPAPSVNKDSNASGFTVTGNGKLIAKAGAVFTEGGDYRGIDLPYLTSIPQPIIYPRWALRQGWEGRFSIAIEVLKSGRVGRYKVMQSTGHRILDEAATAAVRTWKFQPAIKNGQPIVECVQIPVTFKIDE